MNNKFLIIDGNSLFFRAYYGTLNIKNGILKNSQNIPINAILTFSRMMINLIKNINPSHILVAFDTGKKTSRHLEYSDYKINRIKAPNELQIQFPIARELLDSLKIKYYFKDGYEADDIIGTLATKYQHKFSKIVIVSSDRDLLQLVNHNVELLIPQNNSQKYKVINNLNFFNQIGLFPHQIIDFKGLVGDKSDNLPGVKGIGEKTAITLLKQYNSLEGVYEHLLELSEKMQEKLINSRKNAFLSKKLATLTLHVPLNFTLENLVFNHDNYETSLNFYKKYELFSLIKQITKK